MRGNAMSGAPIISGTNQLPKPPIIAGITMKKIMIRPCEVTNTLYSWAGLKTCTPGIHQLRPDPHRHQAADDPRDESEHQVHGPDVLVIGRIDEAPPPGRVVMRMVIVVMVVSG